MTSPPKTDAVPQRPASSGASEHVEKLDQVLLLLRGE